jgi:hypothetical protein
MYTLQSGQIENALRGGGVPDISAKEMLQGVANCGSPLEHRGGLVMSRVPRDNGFMFPGMSPVEPSPSFYFANNFLSENQTIINIPPWQNIPFEPIPYPEYPEWKPIPYPDLPPDNRRDTTVFIPGPVSTGPINTTEVTTNELYSTTINNAGDINNNNNFFNAGPVFHGGPVINNNNVINNNRVVNNQQVINQGPVNNNSITHNQITHTYGPTYSYSDTTHYSGPHTFYGDTFIEGDKVTIEGDDVTIAGDGVIINGDDFTANNTIINIGGPSTTDVTIEGDTIVFAGDVFLPDPNDPDGPPLGPLAAVVRQLLTDIEWDGTQLIKKFRTFTILGAETEEDDDVVVSGTSCPATPINAAASNWSDMP